MAWFTLYNVVTPRSADELVEGLEELIGQLSWSVVEIRDGEEGSRLIKVDREGLRLGLWVVPLDEGAFGPPAFDEACDEELAASIRAVCKVGAREGPDPADTVLRALDLAATLAEDGRVYDIHARLALDPASARDLAAQDFDIRRFTTYHYLAPPSGDPAHSWLHLHGLAKFFCPDLEAFDVHPEVSHKALGLMMQVAEGLATQRSPGPDEPQPYGHGAYRLRWSTEVRPELEHFSEADFDDEHLGPCLVIEDAGSLGSLDQLLRGAYEMEPKTLAECEAEQRVWQERLPAIRAAWAERGDDQIMVRAALEVGRERAVEHIWVSIESWRGDRIGARLLNDAYRDPSMVRGTPITFAEEQISGVSLIREGRVFNEIETLKALDPKAATLLDSALESSPSGLQAQQSDAPDGSFKARFVDDGRVAYLHVVEAESKEPVIDPVWLYNRLPTPPLLDDRCLADGLMPLMSQIYTDQRDPTEAPKAKRVELIWEPEGVTATIDGEVWARVDLGRSLATSKLITLPSPYGHPWPADEPREVTVKESSPPEDRGP